MPTARKGGPRLVTCLAVLVLASRGSAFLHARPSVGRHRWAQSSRTIWVDAPLRGASYSRAVPSLRAQQDDAPQEGRVARARPPSRNPFKQLAQEVREILGGCLNQTMEGVEGVDRCALYLRVEDPASRSVELFPAAVCPPASSFWMFGHITDVSQARGEVQDPWILSDGCLAAPVRHTGRTLGVLVVSQRLELLPGVTAYPPVDKLNELLWSSEQTHQLQRKASELGAFLTDTPSLRTLLSGATIGHLADDDADVTTAVPISAGDERRVASVPVVTTYVPSRNLTLDVYIENEELGSLNKEELAIYQNETNILILKVALPVMGALALEPILSLIDTFYISQWLGAAALSAYGLSERVFALMFYILNFLATSTTPIVANLRARGEEEVARELVGRMLFFAFTFGLVLIPVLQALCVPILTLLGARPENFQEAATYYQVRSLGAPAVMLMAASNGALRGYLDTATPLIVAVIAFIVDYSIDPTWVYPQDPDGLGGAGAATVVSEWLSALLFLIRFRFLNVSPLVDFFPPWAEIKPVVQASLQVFFRTIVFQLFLAASCAAAARIGPIDIAAHQVALQLWLPPAFVCDAFSVAASGLVADALGTGDRAQARARGVRLLQWGVAVGGLLAAVVAGLELRDPNVMPRLFTEDAGIVDKVTPIIWLIALMQPLNGFVNVGAGVLQGSQDFAYQLITMFLSAIFAGSLFFVLRDEGLTAVWETLLAFQVMRAIGVGYRIWADPSGPLSEYLPKRKRPTVITGNLGVTTGLGNLGSSAAFQTRVTDWSLEGKRRPGLDE